MSSVLARARGLAPARVEQAARIFGQSPNAATFQRSVRLYNTDRQDNGKYSKQSRFSKYSKSQDNTAETSSKYQNGGPKKTSRAHQAQYKPEDWGIMVNAHNQAELEQDAFSRRHIGPRDSDIPEMLKVVGLEGKSLDDFVKEVIPEGILATHDRNIVAEGTKRGETTLQARFRTLMKPNNVLTSHHGRGYYPVFVPPVIQRNLLENPGWYTSYTPYQAEISQGRMESLLNFQTMVSDLTGLPVANASLLDEGTAAAEAMTLSFNTLPTSRQKQESKIFVISDALHPQTKLVLKGRAEGLGIEIREVDFADAQAARTAIEEIGQSVTGIMVQYPDTYGRVDDWRDVSKLAKELGVLLSAATDLSALTVLTPPGEWGADIAFGNSQRFGVPMGNGGPHAAFFAVQEKHKRRIPGRLIGVTRDRLGRPALRLALQTREQHIRREKATSNVCTAQALLANMAAMYAVYHGPAHLKAMATENIRAARTVAAVALQCGFEVAGVDKDQGVDSIVFDTIAIKVASQKEARSLVYALRDVNIGVLMPDAPAKSDGSYLVTMAFNSSINAKTYERILAALHFAKHGEDGSSAQVDSAFFVQSFKSSTEDILSTLPDWARRTSPYLTHPVFNTHHSETEMLRYLHHLQSKDLSQVHSMIPLGSCTMKLNPTSAMQLIGMWDVANTHPLSTYKDRQGWRLFVNELKVQLARLTGMADTLISPNSGAQGEFAGLQTIRKYQQTNAEPGVPKRDICLIPVSAHGTNPASAAMAGLRTVPVKCDTATGNLDIEDLKAKCAKHKDELCAIMITYPSTFGVFEPYVKDVCQIVHDHGGLVYMDGANMNAQIGLMSPGELGADVCHLNLHKTFCIPHGGGGPGVGPICVNEKLSDYLPGKKKGPPQVTSAQTGSASILPISWAYITMMGDDGLQKATKLALLNANYILGRLKDHYPILYTNTNGRCAHEFIVDARPFEKTAGIQVADIAKRLQDYGFHAPTMSWPVPGTLMIEPTESESKQEMDRFADAMISIRQEIREIEEGRQPKLGNVLKNAPHPQLDIIRGDGGGKWERPYSREQATYPLPYLIEKKFWPSVGRADDTYGDTNLFCTCPPVEDTTAE